MKAKTSKKQKILKSGLVEDVKQPVKIYKARGKYKIVDGPT